MGSKKGRNAEIAESKEEKQKERKRREQDVGRRQVETKKEIKARKWIRK
jgi:hypothetical protein